MQEGLNALLTAASYGHVGSVAALLGRGARVNALGEVRSDCNVVDVREMRRLERNRRPLSTPIFHIFHYCVMKF